MAEKIIIEPSRVWGYFNSHAGELEDSMHEIARNDEYGITIYVTDSGGKETLPEIDVEADGVPVYSETAISDRDCEKTVRGIYNKYLSDSVVSLLSEKYEPIDTDDDEWRDYEIDSRELELDDAVQAFIEATVEGAAYYDFYDEEMFEDIKDHFLEYLARKWELPIRRPMVLEDENGAEFFEEYPYECMIFDDEDNPIYK